MTSFSMRCRYDYIIFLFVFSFDVSRIERQSSVSLNALCKLGKSRCDLRTLWILTLYASRVWSANWKRDACCILSQLETNALYLLSWMCNSVYLTWKMRQSLACSFTRQQLSYHWIIGLEFFRNLLWVFWPFAYFHLGIVLLDHRPLPTKPFINGLLICLTLSLCILSLSISSR